MKKNLCIDVTGKNSGGGDIFISQLLGNLELYLKDFDKIIIFNNSFKQTFFNSNKIINIRIPYIFRNRFLLFIWQNFFIDFFLIKYSCKIFLSMNSIYLGRFKSYVVIHQNSLPFSKIELKKYNNIIFLWKVLTQRTLLKITYKKSLCTIFLTTYANNLVQSFIKKKINFNICPLGIENFFDRSPKNNLNLIKKYKNNTEINVLYVSSLHLYKNHKVLFEAINILSNIYKNIKLTLIGEKISFLYNDIFSRINNNIKNKITYIEKEKNYNIKNYQFKSDLFIFPSTCETFPLSLLEAMRASVPVLVSDYIKNISVVNQDVVSFNPNDPIDLSNKIKFILENDKYRMVSAQNSYDYAKQFTWEKTNKKIYNIIKQL